MLSRVINNIFYYNLNNRDILRKVTVKIKLEIIDIQKEVTVKTLLDSGATGLVMSSEFAKKQEFKLKKMERLIYVRNINGFLNKKRPIEHTVEVNIYYQEHREKTVFDVIGGQKQSMILRILQFTCHNPEIDWRIGEVKMMRCLKECGKWQRPKQEKSEWQRQRNKKKRGKSKKKRSRRGKRRKNQKRRKQQR